jgi:hypothetical protein
MKFFRKRITPSENIAFMGVMCAVDAVFALLGLLPFSDLVIVLILPLVSAWVGLLCDKRYLSLYLLASCGVVIAVTCYDVGGTLFYTIPAILSGTLYGFLAKIKIPVSFLVFATALLGMGLNYASLPLIRGLYDIDMIASIKTMLGLNAYRYVDDIIPMFVFGYSLAQAGITHLVIQIVFSSFDFQYPEEESLSFLYPILAICFSVMAVALALSVVALGYVFWAIGVYFTSFSLLQLFKKNPWWIIFLSIILLLGSVYAFAAFYSSFPADSGFLLSSLFLISLDTPSLLSSLLWIGKRKPSAK